MTKSPFGKRLLWMVLMVIVGMVLAIHAEAANCTGADCVCGDTLVGNYTIPYANTFYCYDVDQALKIADNVWLDCNNSTVVGNGVGGSAGFRLGNGSQAFRCWATGFQYHMQFGGWYAYVEEGGGWSSTDEGLHFSTGTGANIVRYMWIHAPVEAVYLLQSSGNDIRGCYLEGGSNAIYAKQGSANNFIQSNDLVGGPNRVHLDGAGNNNWFDHNNYTNGIIKSNNSTYPNYVGPAPINATLNNQDGSLIVY